ncbi:YihY/virulence factor BrkB family protein [Aurantiacibacter sediminis]|uniref:YihY/virulence factor BrkB family protein n=1 Tax=Aurantiacibacter sediminis TaxID=2793064 RepID=A0ABS0N063_9SPHN|nr:YhjD/YihY/BrkB family envelope integrity protein [Aurantiacibacter sediminis]MBH5321361.1 YihY/virulence factor BrkB family protein [Aurantiacibacter sediminis]
MSGLADIEEETLPEDRELETATPEARRKAALERKQDPDAETAENPWGRAWVITKRVAIGCFNDGLIHAGNLAYMSVLAIFPFFILGAAVLSVVGEDYERTAAIDTLALALPPMVANVIEPVARNVVQMRSGWLLWGGALVALWTVGSLVETIRDILRRAYGTRATKAFWTYRLFSSGIILGAVFLLVLSLFAQIMLGAAQEFIDAYLPQLSNALGTLEISRIIPAIGLYLSLFLLFISLTPEQYRTRRYPKWPGALLVTVWWISVTVALPPVLRSLFAYNLTYGSLAGFMIALFFFWLVGLGMVAGAELNAALAETPEEERNRIGGPANDEAATAAGKEDETQ